MTEFTQAGIDRLRDIMNDGGEYWSRSLALDALDEIERQQERIAELECQLKSKKIVIESKEQTIREFVEKMLDLRKR